MRPPFLTALCILTFTWNAINFISNFETYQNPELLHVRLKESMEKSNKVLSQYGLSKEEITNGNTVLSKETKVITNEGVKKSAMFSMISCVLLILGAVFMWDLKKQGLLIYLGGTLLGSLAPTLGVGGFYGNMMTLFCGFTAALMYLLYYFNRKSLA